MQNLAARASSVLNPCERAKSYTNGPLSRLRMESSRSLRQSERSEGTALIQSTDRSARHVAHEGHVAHYYVHRTMLSRPSS